MTLKDENNIIPILNGLVLAGGKSVRMGQDKSIIEWHGKEQRYYMADMLQQLCTEVFISCRPEQEEEINSNYKTLPDTYTELGPYGGILSAFKQAPDRAWLVTACDLPLLDANTLQYLIQNRDSSAVATTYESPFDGLPEPLIAIWEPKSFSVLLSFLERGYTCPRKVLRNSDIKMIKPLNPDTVMNVNTPRDAEKAKDIMHHKIATN